jgi:Family of unknown function (DUF6345)
MGRLKSRPEVIVALLFAAPVMFAPSRASALPTYYIDESTDFTGNGCENADLNDVTSSLQDVFDAFGYTGDRFINQSAWPHDFVEACSSSFGSGGLDITYADDASIAVYAGHGNTGFAQWGFARNSMCRVDMASTTTPTTKGVMRLGQMSQALVRQ